METRIRELESEVGGVTTRLVDLEHDLALHREKLERITRLFNLQTERLNFLRRQYELAVARLSKRLVEIYQNDDVTTLDVLISSGSVADMIELLPHVPYRDALREMACADGLLLIQGSNCNEQVPAKLYEYLRARRPLIALTDSAGDTATVLRATGVDAIARLDSAADIARVLSRFVQGARQGMLATDSAIAQASRSGRAGQLAALLDRVSLQGRR